MAAGDVVIQFKHRLGDQVVAGGTVQLDGSNPTPVELKSVLREVLGGVAVLQGSSAPGDDPNTVSVVANGTALDVYAWKNTSGTDPTMVASTDNARLVCWYAWGRA